MRCMALITTLLLAAEGFTYSPSRIHHVGVSRPIIPVTRSARCQGRIGTCGTSVSMNASWHNDKATKSSKAEIPVKLLKGIATSLFFVALFSTPAAMAAKSTAQVEHLHTGQKIANFFRSFGLPDISILFIISALPVVELRGAVPVGVWMGLPITTVLPACIVGNMMPIIPILFLLRNERLKTWMAPILKRAEKKSASLGVGSLQKQWISLAAFVGVPLPGTGAWTGAMGSFLLGMPTAVALSSIFAGVVSAGMIMSAITLAGKKGGIAALTALFVFTTKELISKSDEEDGDETREDTSGSND